MNKEAIYTVPVGISGMAVVDAADGALAAQYDWKLVGSGYAGVRVANETVYLHRLVVAAPNGAHVDHINGNKLDNRKANLRLCTKSQNGCNRARQVNNRSGFKGVSFHKASGLWLAQLTVNKKKVLASYHATPEEAARAYDVAAKQHHGNFARLNFPQ